MSKFDPVRKKIKRKNYNIHILYTVIVIILLAIGYFIGKTYQELKQTQLHHLGSLYITDTDSLKSVIEYDKYVIKTLKSYLDSLPLGLPLKDIVVHSKYGYRNDPIDSVRSFHYGIDLKCMYEEPIYTTGSGIVVFSGVLDGYGNCVVIKHLFNHKTLYAHLSHRLVEVNDTVGNNTVIGLAGSSGKSSGVHLHYEVLHNEIRKNPIFYVGYFKIDSIQFEDAGYIK